MSWLSDYIATRRKRRAELYKDRPWITPVYWLAVICTTLAMLYGYSRAVDYYFFTENVDAAYLKNAITEQAFAEKEVLLLHDLIPYKEYFETACFIFVPIRQDPTTYMARFKGHAVDNIPWHFRSFFVLKSAEAERIIAIKNEEITTPPIPGTKLPNKKEQTSLFITDKRTNPDKFYTCAPFETAGFTLKRIHTSPNSPKYEMIFWSLSPFHDVSKGEK